MVNRVGNRSYEQIEYDYLKSRGYTPAGIAGALGNLEKESGFSPTAFNPNEQAIGIAQWENDRRTRGLDSTAREMGVPETNINAQLEYMGKELSGPYSDVDSALRSAVDPREAANEWNRHYEISGDYSQDRENNASRIYTQISSGQTLTGGGDGGAQGIVATVPGLSLDTADKDYFLKKEPYSLPYINKHQDEFDFALQDKQYDAIRDFINKAPSKKWHIGRDYPSGDLAPDSRDRIYTLKYPTTNGTANVSIHGDSMFMSTIYKPLIEGKFNPNNVTKQEKKDAGPLGSNPLEDIANAISGVGSVVSFIGTFFDKVTWIFDVSHFFRLMLYIFGFVAIAGGLGMITFGAKFGAEES